MIDKIQSNVDEVKKKHSAILSAPQTDDSKYLLSTVHSKTRVEIEDTGHGQTCLHIKNKFIKPNSSRYFVAFDCRFDFQTFPEGNSVKMIFVLFDNKL